MITFKEYITESNDISIGININDKIQDFTGQILRGEKTIESRSQFHQHLRYKFLVQMSFRQLFLRTCN
jgi:hypothetical protein